MRILPVNLNAMLVELESLEATLALFETLKAEPIDGVTELVPAARTVLVRFDPSVCQAGTLARALAARQGGQQQRVMGELLRLPVRYEGEDLPAMADHLGLSVAGLIERHTAATWQVAFTGFAPGFAYMTGDDPVFDVPRRASPRTSIPAGSVALAGRFCGIYPRASPGGWQLLGTTDVPMWDLARTPPALLQPGVRVQFVDASTEAGAALAEAWRQRLDAARDFPAAQAPRGGCVSSGSSLPEQTGGESSAPGSGLDTLRTLPDRPVSSGSDEPGQRPAEHAVANMLPLPAANDPSDGQGSRAASSVIRPGGAVFEIRATGLQALFQDLGRAGQASQGVSVSGALDRHAYLMANRLVGNQRNAPAIELLHGGFSVHVLSPAVVAVTGAEGPLQLHHADGSVWPAERGRPVALDAGDTLTVGAPVAGLRSYLAVRGGFRIEPVLGSVATDTLSGIGPAPLGPGQRLWADRLSQGAVMMHPEGVEQVLPRPGDTASMQAMVLDLVLGPRADWFDEDAITLLQEQLWQVSLQSNRVGLRLMGEQPLKRAAAFEGVELPSEGTVPGALQVPPSGQPVLFMADHPLTGGYPVIGCVTPDHLERAAQLPAGASIRFRVISPFRPWWPQD
ncbi:MAG: 5-oxoprolinase/urea amidolyase family protein [Lautropia sp.]|nr:5-oxoprolinase/urea amidolyase family protein [Lautropia sp.]